MSSNDCRALILYHPPVALQDANRHSEERYVILPDVLSWISRAARQSILPPLLYQPIPTGVDLQKGELYTLESYVWLLIRCFCSHAMSRYLLWNSATNAENYMNSFIFLSYDISCQWRSTIDEGKWVGNTSGEGIERFNEFRVMQEWAAGREVAPTKNMGPGQRWARL
ncbi:hypothetical protein B0H11DRAFT_2225576 [Mycena galericulata]|nr:hypothetical protein B0H11DRAFT_2225576 [Mycena galericulata]